MAALALLLAVPLAAAPRVEVEGLMPPNAAVLLVDGQRKLVKVGETFEGVTLVAAYSRTATLEIDGVQSVLGLSRRVGTHYEEAPRKSVAVPRNERLQYQVMAAINGRRTAVIVDTGANVVAMNSEHARRFGLDLKDAPVGVVETAGGKVNARQVTLRAVDVGGIVVNNVEATVLEGNYPTLVLLGMSYLKHVKIEENQGVLTLVQAF